MNLSGSRILVTGGAGLVGSHIVDDLVKEGATVVVYDNLVRGKPEHLDKARAIGKVELVKADLRDRDQLRSAVAGCDYVFHQAAAWLRQCQAEPRLSIDVNVVGTFNLLEACVDNKVKKLVAASSSSVYGEGLYLPTDEAHPFNNDLFYGASKVATEQYYRAFHKKYGLDFVALRYLNVYGPRQPYEAAYMDVIMHFLNRIDANEPPVVRGDGSATVDLVYVEDVARANVMALKSEVTNDFFNVCTGKETTLIDLAHLLIRLRGKEGTLKPVFEQMDGGLVTRRWGSPKKAQEVLGFVATTSVEEGMRRVIAWREETKKRALGGLDMCGIAGVLRVDGGDVDPTWLPRMCDALRHRGPDDDGTFTQGPIALGHRRLAIVDRSARGRNPMPNEDGSVQLVFNGEIYNHRDFRGDLVARGHRFRSETDTEVLVHLYEERGVEAIADLDGMFAFALWDEGSKKLVLGRDRFGVKPLYVVERDGYVAFASEAKAFLALPWFRAKADARGIAEHFAFHTTLGERTLFDGVAMLAPATVRVFERGRATSRRYWQLSLDVSGATIEEHADGVRERFEAAVRRQLMSDVPVGSFLSGGMDTGSISAVAAREIPGMHTFTCGFRLPEGMSDLEKHFDERAESHALAAHLGTVHHEIDLGPEAMPPSLPRVVWHLDEPRVGISYQVLYTSAMIRRYVVVVLSGVGGDELFGGYPWRYAHVDGAPADRFDENYYGWWARILTDAERDALFTAELRRELAGFSPKESFLAVTAESRGADPLARALHYDFSTFLPSLLVVDDKLSMACSVESRVPFLDNALVDYAARIPASQKVRGREGKLVLRRAMRGLLPEATIERRKQGFTPPDRTWYRNTHRAFIEDLVLGRRALERGFFEPKVLRALVDEHMSGVRDRRFFLWSLMAFEWWQRLFVDRDPLPPWEVPS